MTWSWHFHSQEQLQAALEEYHADGAEVRRYGQPGADGGQAGGADYENRVMRVWRQNSEIDRRMAIMENRAPWIHRLIGIYYLGGLCAERDGWAMAAKRCGLEADRDSRWARDAFERQVAWCVERLWHAR